jgi:hypothetical protein
MQSLSILTDVDPADFIRSDAPISHFARSSGSYDRLDPEQQPYSHFKSDAGDGRVSVGSRPSVLETAQAFGGISTGIPRHHQQSSSVSSSTPQLAAVLPPAPNSGLQLHSLQKTASIKLPSQVLLVLIDGCNGDAVIDRLSNSTVATKIALSTGDRLKFIDGQPCSNANDAIAKIQLLHSSKGENVELDFVSRTGTSFHVVASRQQVQPQSSPSSYLFQASDIIPHSCLHLARLQVPLCRIIQAC